MRRFMCLATLVLGFVAGAADAQDFATAFAPWPDGGAFRLLEDALPDARPAASLECGITRWFGVPQLETRALGAAVRLGDVALAAGLSQTGSPEIGWTAIGIAAGAARENGGVAIRGIARRDRLTPFAFDGDARTAGGEAGAGAWVTGTGGVRVWASAPQLWREGAAPPLRRALALGLAWSGDGVSAWLARRAVVAADDTRRGEHEIGLALAGRGAVVWCSARDQPWRASLGVRAARGFLTVGARAESHPDLDATTQMGVALVREPSP